MKVSQDMRKAKGENGERLFSREEWLTIAQIQGFFSRLSSSRRRRAGPSPSTAVDDKSDEELIDEEEVSHDHPRISCHRNWLNASDCL